MGLGDTGSAAPAQLTGRPGMAIWTWVTEPALQPAARMPVAPGPGWLRQPRPLEGPVAEEHPHQGATLGDQGALLDLRPPVQAGHPPQDGGWSLGRRRVSLASTTRPPTAKSERSPNRKEQRLCPAPHVAPQAPQPSFTWAETLPVRSGPDNPHPQSLVLPPLTWAHGCPPATEPPPRAAMSCASRHPQTGRHSRQVCVTVLYVRIV